MNIIDLENYANYSSSDLEFLPGTIKDKIVIDTGRVFKYSNKSAEKAHVVLQVRNQSDEVRNRRVRKLNNTLENLVKDSSNFGFEEEKGNYDDTNIMQNYSSLKSNNHNKSVEIELMNSKKNLTEEQGTGRGSNHSKDTSKSPFMR